MGFVRKVLHGVCGFEVGLLLFPFLCELFVSGAECGRGAVVSVSRALVVRSVFGILWVRGGGVSGCGYLLSGVLSAVFRVFADG